MMTLSSLLYRLPRALRAPFGLIREDDLPHLKLWHRLVWAKGHLPAYQSDYRVVYEDGMDDPARILVPDPNWMACALRGGILPPVEVYHRLEIDEQGRVLNGHILHETPPIGPLTEEQAIEYLIQKDVPEQVWRDSSGNRPKMVVCRKEQVPADRTYRNAWSIAA